MRFKLDWLKLFIPGSTKSTENTPENTPSRATPDNTNLAHGSDLTFAAQRNTYITLPFAPPATPDPVHDFNSTPRAQGNTAGAHGGPLGGLDATRVPEGDEGQSTPARPPVPPVPPVPSMCPEVDRIDSLNARGLDLESQIKRQKVEDSDTLSPKWFSLLNDPAMRPTDCTFAKLMGLFLLHFVTFWFFDIPTLTQARSWRFRAWAIVLFALPAAGLGAYIRDTKRDVVSLATIVTLCACGGTFALVFLARLFVVSILRQNSERLKFYSNAFLTILNIIAIAVLIVSLICMCFDNPLTRPIRMVLLPASHAAGKAENCFNCTAIVCTSTSPQTSNVTTSVASCIKN